jgi:hypothetical protein
MAAASMYQSAKDEQIMCFFNCIKHASLKKKRAGNGYLQQRKIPHPTTTTTTTTTTKTPSSGC